MWLGNESMKTNALIRSKFPGLLREGVSKVVEIHHNIFVRVVEEGESGFSGLTKHIEDTQMSADIVGCNPAAMEYNDHELLRTKCGLTVVAVPTNRKICTLLTLTPTSTPLLALFPQTLPDVNHAQETSPCKSAVRH